MMASTKEWANRLIQGVNALLRPGELLRPPPPDTDDPVDEKVRALLAVRQILGLDEAVPRATAQAAMKTAGRATCTNNAATIEDGVALVLQAVDRELGAALATLSSQKVHDLGLIRVSDFNNQLCYLDISGWGVLSLDVMGAAARDGVLLLGLTEKLEPGHPLRSLEAEAYCITETPGKAPESSLVLGFPDERAIFGRGQPKAYYTLQRSLMMTRWLARYQLEEARKRDERNRADDEREAKLQEARENELLRKFPLAEIRNLRKELADLKAEKTRRDGTTVEEPV
jgi:hypothetical protein